MYNTYKMAHLNVIVFHHHHPHPQSPTPQKNRKLSITMRNLQFDLPYFFCANGTQPAITRLRPEWLNPPVLMKYFTLVSRPRLYQDKCG